MYIVEFLPNTHTEYHSFGLVSAPICYRNN